MRFCYWGKDGGAESTVWGFWLVEIKSLFSIALLRFEPGSRDAYHEHALLRFEPGSRDAYHEHAFNCVSWVLRGLLSERFYLRDEVRLHRPSWIPVVTRRSDFHKVTSYGRTWVLTLRGPWTRTWREAIPSSDDFPYEQIVTLEHGRREVSA